MRWFLLLMCMSVAASLNLWCESPHCLVKYQVSQQWLEFYVGDNQLKIEDVDTHLHINCNAGNVFDNPMPYFTDEFQVSDVILTRCPLPTFQNVSLTDVLEALNVKLQPKLGEVYLTLDQFPSGAQLATHQFDGLDNLTNFTMGYSNAKLPDDVFTKIPNLRNLSLHGVELPSGGVNSLPRSLESLYIRGESTLPLPNTLQELFVEVKLALPNLVDLTVHQWFALKPTRNIAVQKNGSFPLETLRLLSWRQRELAPLEQWQCEHLRLFELTQSQIDILPESIIAACPRIEELSISISEIPSLPAKLLEGATSLKRFTISSCSLNSVPEGLFQGAPNLVAVDLSSNGIHTLPSGIFAGLPNLQSINLRQNKLDNAALGELAPLRSLTYLNLGFNKLGDLCKKNGYSPLSNLIHLKYLTLEDNSNSTICRDWRENMIFLEYLNIDSSRTLYLEYTDFEYKRDASVKNAVVKLSGSEIIVNFSEEDYKKALTAPESGATLTFMDESTMNYSHLRRVCDCRMYWLKRAMQDASQAIKVKGLKCDNAMVLEELTLERLCPELATTNAASN